MQMLINKSNMIIIRLQSPNDDRYIHYSLNILIFMFLTDPVSMPLKRIGYMPFIRKLVTVVVALNRNRKLIHH